MWSYADISIWLPPSLPWTRGWSRFSWREDDDAWFLEGPLDGFRKRHVTVEVRDGQLEVRALREPGLFDRTRRSFRQIVTLPEGADVGGIDARFDSGWLSIRIPKLEYARRRRVPIRVNGALPAPAQRPPLLERLRSSLGFARA